LAITWLQNDFRKILYEDEKFNSNDGRETFQTLKIQDARTLHCSQRLLPYLQLLVSADSEVALVLGVLCPQPVDYLIQSRYIGLPLVPLTSLLAVTSYLVVSERNRLRS